MPGSLKRGGIADEILEISNRRIHVWFTELPDGTWAVDYQAFPRVTKRALSAGQPPRRRVVVEATKEDALAKAKERFRIMFHMRKLNTIDPSRLVYS